MGNDFKRFAFKTEYCIPTELQIAATIGQIRNGEGTALGDFNTDYLDCTVEEGYDDFFSWGVVAMEQDI